MSGLIRCLKPPEDAQHETISRIQFMKMRRNDVPVESAAAVMMPVSSSDTLSVEHVPHVLEVLNQSAGLFVP